MQANDWGELDWDEVNLAPSLLQQWTAKPVHFKKRVIRPRPSRPLKYSGGTMMTGSLVWFFGAPFLDAHYWPATISGSGFKWQFVAVVILWLGLFLALGLSGSWLRNRGAKRRR